MVFLKDKRSVATRFIGYFCDGSEANSQIAQLLFARDFDFLFLHTQLECTKPHYTIPLNSKEQNDQKTHNVLETLVENLVPGK
ncbi:hypothetical protein EMQU_2993 (plasmid) [Enterococcus mundtii QU 25]|nr:hypothetical protein EMQU_2907 [Enterococcus mundtii QU 25]BAO08550.1 hypothetical protein EMQU_2993 [Enterococcus mundtii QU 25]